MNATIFIAALVAFGLVMVGMAIGVMVTGRRLAGSCGGLSNMKDRLGEPMCECGSKPGESCGRDEGKTFDFPADTAVVARREPATV